jgi:PPP family 3-phenylpropionic acid transporter
VKVKNNPYVYLIPVFWTSFSILAITSPFLPILIRGLGYSPSMVGLLMGVVEIAGIGGPFFLGGFADRCGWYKPALIITVLLILLPALPLALIPTPLISALLLAVLATGCRSVSPIMDAMTTIIVGKTGNYGKIRSVGSLAFAVTLVFLQWSPFLPLNTPLNISIWLIILVVIALVFLFILPTRYTGLPPRSPEKGQKAPGGPKTRTPLLVLGLIMIGINRLSMAPVNGFFSLYVSEYVKWDAVGMLWALSAVAEIPMILVSKSIINRFGALRTLAVSGLAVSFRLLLYAFFPVKAAVIFAQLLHSPGYGLFHPAAVAFIASCVPPERRALGMTLYISLGTGLPAFLGNIAGGFIVEHSGYPALFAFFAVFPVLSLGIYFIIARSRKTRGA